MNCNDIKQKSNIQTEDIVAFFTGHRPKGLPWGYDEETDSCIKFKEDLFMILQNAILSGVDTFLTGMAEGFDMIGAETILKLKKQFPNIKLIAIVPCLGQEKFWKESQQKRYTEILSKCDDRVVLHKSYTDYCMNERNKYMVDHSSICIALFDGKPSGTGNTVRYAKEKGLKFKIINPKVYEAVS